MKELYVSPELELICLAAEERLASNEVDFDGLQGSGNGIGLGADVSTADIDIPLY